MKILEAINYYRFSDGFKKEYINIDKIISFTAITEGEKVKGTSICLEGGIGIHIRMAPEDLKKFLEGGDVGLDIQKDDKLVLEERDMRFFYLNLYKNYWTAHDTKEIAMACIEKDCLHIAVKANIEEQK